MFVQLFVELTLLFLLISYGVAIISQKLPSEKIKQLLGVRKGRGYLMVAGLGAVTPFCSCSTIPILTGLLKARAGFGPTMTFLFTSPLLNRIAIALFIPVLGLKMTIWYAGLALVTSVIARVQLKYFGFERFVKHDIFKPKGATLCAASNTSGDNSCANVEAKIEPSLWSKAWHESWSLFRSMFPYMLIAMVIGSVVHGFVPTNFFAEVAVLQNSAAISNAALIGISLYIRVTALLPLVESFLAKGVSLGVIVALLIVSGGASLPEMILLKRLFNWPLLFAFLTVIFIVAVIGGFVSNWFLI
jgi:uncharacterized membrane protein YraQ (UPF0718 family)